MVGKLLNFCVATVPDGVQRHDVELQPLSLQFQCFNLRVQDDPPCYKHEVSTQGHTHISAWAHTQTFQRI
jgi:hypothetical protein